MKKASELEEGQGIEYQPEPKMRVRFERMYGQTGAYIYHVDDPKNGMTVDLDPDRLQDEIRRNSGKVVRTWGMEEEEGK